MEQKPTVSSQDADPGSSKVTEWEDLEQELATLWSLSSALAEAKDKKLTLQRRIHSLLQVKAELLSRSNELDEMREKLEARKEDMENMSARNKVSALDAKKQEERLSIEVRSLLVAGTALSKARRQLQESNRSLVEERGYVQLKNLQKTLRLRQQFMVSQVSLLFPVRTSTGPAKERELESFPSSHKSVNSAASRPVTIQGSLTIIGLQLTMLPFTKSSFFKDKKEVQRSATALGYVAHAVSLVASYLEVPLRYPLRLGCSRSYINDHAPSIEPSQSELSSLAKVSSNTKSVEFPLFLEGQDTTRAAYAVFLLNKDLEQLLNFIGVKSVGPRHVLANWKELLRTVLSADYIDS